MSEKIFELEERLSELSSDQAMWDSLTQHPGWKALRHLAEQQSKEFLLIFRAPLASMDKVPAQEYTKGQVAGIDLFASIPDLQLEMLKSEREILEKEIANESVAEKADGNGAAGGSGIGAFERGRDDAGNQFDLLDERIDPFGNRGG